MLRGRGHRPSPQRRCAYGSRVGVLRDSECSPHSRELRQRDRRDHPVLAVTNLDLVRELLEGLDQRREARIEAGNLGEWQTELNEVARILHYIVAHLEPVPCGICEQEDDELPE